MCKKPDDSLIGQCENNITQGLLLVSLLWNQKIVFGKSQMLSQFVFRAFLYLNSSTVHFVLNWYWTHFDKSYRENQTDASNRFCSWPLTAHQETVSYKHRTSWALSLCIHLNQFVAPNSLRKSSNLLGMKLRRDVTSLLFQQERMIY